ncbi:MAG: hypothetical protein BAJATHORv1_10498 [Candidatus Thorarchaeota archaeon]|nr:MAG: hypothetical protein BAJATHORv1_10498 [Candidatus Thorarchaeota archaeon]
MQLTKTKVRHNRIIRRYFAIFTLILLLAIPMYTEPETAINNGEIQLENHSKFQDASVGNPTYVNLTQYIEEIYNTTSQTRIEEYTQSLSENYPARIWNISINAASTNLLAAMAWVNTTLKTITDESLIFKQIEGEPFLFAKQEGSDTNPRKGIVLTGILDSENYPGANSVGISVAIILELANILHEYSFDFDIYYVLSIGGRYDSDIDYGSRAFVEWIQNNNIDIFTTLAFDKMLFSRYGFINSNKIALRTSTISNYHFSDYIPDLLVQISKQYGSNKFIRLIDNEKADRSTAYEMWRVNLPGIHVTQGYYPDPNSDSIEDVWDNDEYKYDKPVETVSATAAMLVQLGMMNGNHAAAHYMNSTIPTGQSSNLFFVASVNDFVNVTISWPEGTQLQANIIRSSTSTSMYQRIENDSLIIMKYRSVPRGEYEVVIENLGSHNATVSMNITYYEDFDGDSLHGGTEAELGTSVYFADSDSDNINDNVEIQMGTSPLLEDSDNDGANDFEELQYGSNPYLNDTDGDQLLDGFEIARNMDPTNTDSDDDEIGDYDEIYTYFTDPTREDSDFDGLEDGFEISAGLDPLSPDSDGDSLGDLFEILNQIDPTKMDTDGDGWSDAYEVEFCLSPTNPDTDGDGIPDGIDWDPQEHWVNVVAPIALLSIILLTGIFGFLKLRLYKRLDAEENEATA